MKRSSLISNNNECLHCFFYSLAGFFPVAVPYPAVAAVPYPVPVPVAPAAIPVPVPVPVGPVGHYGHPGGYGGPGKIVKAFLNLNSFLRIILAQSNRRKSLFNSISNLND